MERYFKLNIKGVYYRDTGREDVVGIWDRRPVDSRGVAMFYELTSDGEHYWKTEDIGSTGCETGHSYRV